MENTLAVILMVLFLIMGSVGGVVFAPEKITEVEKIVEVEILTEVPVEVPVEVLVADISQYRNEAVDEFLNYMDDEDLLECDGNSYDDSEVSVSRVYDDYTVEINDEDYTVDFSVKLKYDEDDEKSCRESYDVSVYYEDDEKPVVTIL